MANSDLIIRNVRIKDRGYELCDIQIDDSHITRVQPNIPDEAAHEIDGEGGLASPTFVDSHSHLDKYGLIHRSDQAAVTGTFAESLRRSYQAKARTSRADAVSNAATAAKLALLNGTGSIRVHSDVDSSWGITGVEAALEVKERFAGVMDIQVLPLPAQNPMDENLKRLVLQAMDAGAAAVGGSPHLELTPQDVISYVDFLFDTAKRYDVDLDLHMDQNSDPTSPTRALEYVLRKTELEGFQGRVTVNHCSALAVYHPSYAARIFHKMHELDVNFVMCPKEELIINGMCSAPVKDLLAAGVNCAYAHNNIADTFSPYGRLDMLEVGLLAIHSSGFGRPQDADTVLDMATTNPAKVLKFDRYGMTPGCLANLVIFSASSAYEVYRQNAERRFVIRQGRVVATTTVDRKLYLDSEELPSLHLPDAPVPSPRPTEGSAAPGSAE